MLPLLTFSVVVLFTLNLSQNEVQVMRSLCHPNILPFYCSFVTKHEVWHVLPLMQLGEGVNYFYVLVIAINLIIPMSLQSHFCYHDIKITNNQALVFRRLDNNLSTE